MAKFSLRKQREKRSIFVKNVLFSLQHKREKGTILPKIREQHPSLGFSRRVCAASVPHLRRVCAASAPRLRRVNLLGFLRILSPPRRVCAPSAPRLRRVCAASVPRLRRVVMDVVP